MRNRLAERMPHLPPHLVESFRSICGEAYGHELSYEEAEQAGVALLDAVVLLAEQKMERQRSNGTAEHILPE